MATSAEIAQQLADYDAKKKSSADYVNEAMAQHGVPEIRSRVSGLRTTLSNTENALNSVDPSVTGRTSRSLVTEAQRSRIVNKEREPIAAQYGDQSRALGNESANLSEQMKAAQLLAEGQMSDYSTGRNALQSRYSDTVASEAEQRRREEADRVFNLQRESSNRDYQLRVKESNKPSGKASTTPNPAQFLVSAFSGYDPNKMKNYTEKEVIPALMANYGIDKNAAAELAYNYRKSVFNE